MLHVACCRCDAMAILTLKALLAHLTTEQRVNIILLQDVDGQTPIHTSALASKASSIESLLNSLSVEQHLCVIFIRDKAAKTALHIAFQAGDICTIKSLVSRLNPEQILKELSLKEFSIPRDPATRRLLLDMFNHEQRKQLVARQYENGRECNLFVFFCVLPQPLAIKCAIK